MEYLNIYEAKTSYPTVFPMKAFFVRSLLYGVEILFWLKVASVMLAAGFRYYILKTNTTVRNEC